MKFILYAITMVKFFINLVVTIAVTISMYGMYLEANATEVIGQFTYGKYQRNVVSVQDWQKKIADSVKMPFSTQLFARTIQTQECGDENGFCVNRIDCGPFQINQIHKKENAWCKKKVAEGKKEVENAKKTGKWGKVLEIRNELYKSQLLWMWGRMKQQVKTYEIPENKEERIRQLCVYHNGSKTKRDYGKRCVLSYKILKNYHINN